MLTKYAKKIIKNYDINSLIYIEELLDDSSSDYHLWYLYLVVKNNNEPYIHCYNWKYTFGENQQKGYNNNYDSILLKDVNSCNRLDYIDISKKLELNYDLAF